MSSENAILYGVIAYCVCMLTTIILILIIYFLMKRTINNMITSATSVVTHTRAHPGEALQTFVIIAGALASSWAVSYLEEKAGDSPLGQKLYDIISKTTANTDKIKKKRAQAKAEKAQPEPTDVKEAEVDTSDIQDAEFHDNKPEQTKPQAQ